MTNAPVTEIDIRTQSAEAGLKRLESAFKAVGASGTAFSTELDDQAQNFLRLTARTDEAARARLQFEAAERRIGAAFDAGKINATQYNTALDQQIARLERAAQRQQGFAQAAQGAAGAGRNMGQVIGQAGFQVQDFAVQVGAGQSAVTALAQQGSQFLSVFGTGGAIAGAALAIGAIVVKLGDWKSAAEKAAEASEKLDDAIKQATDTVDRQVKLGRDLAEQQGRELDRTADLARYYLSLDDATRRYELTRLRLRRLEIEERRDAARETARVASADTRTTLARARRPGESLEDLAARTRRATGDASAQGAQVADALAEFEAGGDIARLYERVFALATETEGGFTKELRAMLPALQRAAEQARGTTEAIKTLTDAIDVLNKPREEQERLANDTTKTRAASAREAAEQERDRQRAAQEAERAAQRALEAEAKFWAENDKAAADALDRLLKRQAAFDEWLTALEREAQLAGETKEIREEELKLIEARNKAGRDLTADEEMRVRRATETKQAYEAQRKAAKETADFVSDSFGRAFDRIGDAAAAMALDGKDAFASLANLGRAVAASLYADFLKLTLINPLRNALFNSGAPTLGGGGFFGLFGGGGGAAAGAGNTLATVGGPGFTGGTFATGGDHAGGLRMVGERGAEIEATGPARIWSAEQTREFLQGGRGRVVINDNRAAGSPDLSISESGDGDIIVTIDERIRRATPGIVEASTIAVGSRMRRGAFP